jgi:hypothetical protein
VVYLARERGGQAHNNFNLERRGLPGQLNRGMAATDVRTRNAVGAVAAVIGRGVGALLAA